MFAIRLSIAAAARTAGAARGLMAAAFYPLMFFSGLYYGFVPAAPLLVLAAYAAELQIGGPARLPVPAWSGSPRGQRIA